MKKLKNLFFFVLVAATLFLIPALAFGTVAEAQSLAEKVKDYTSLAEVSAENNKNNSSLAEFSAENNKNNSSLAEFSAQINKNNSSLAEFSAENNKNNSSLAEFSASDGFSFLYFGDVQFTDDMNSEYAAFGKMLDGAYAKNPEIAFAVSCGDLVNNGQSSAQWTAFLENTAAFFENVPFFAAAGNHESNSKSGKPELMLRLFDFPENGPGGFKEEFYSWEYGNCHITVLNSCVFMGEQEMTEKDFADIKNWLINDWQSAKTDFKIVVLHHPPYGVMNDKTGQAVLANWCPVFEKCGVDLVLSGHQHCYMRTADINGVTYVIGNGGKKEYHAVNTENAAVCIENISSYQIVNISKDTLSLTSYNENHQAVDSWQKSAAKPPATAKGQTVRVFLDVLAGIMRGVR